jgi:tRNA (mo5U34)-methyltransferase
MSEILAKTTRELEKEILSRKWFYKFSLPSGSVTSTYVSDDILKIHETRLEMMYSVLDPLLGSRWPDTTFIDLSSHQGFFAYHLAKRCKRVLGLDFQPQHIESANLIRDVYGLKNCEFRVVNIATLDSNEIEAADVVTMFGLLYNLEDPIGGLRKARKMTKKALLVETQTTILDLTGKIDSGSHLWSNEMHGIFGIFSGYDGPDGAATNIILYPSPKGLLWVMNQLGFSRVEVVAPPMGAYEQLATGKRMMVIGYV